MRLRHLLALNMALTTIVVAIHAGASPAATYTPRGASQTFAQWVPARTG
jgi:hypothetical protein